MKGANSNCLCIVDMSLFKKNDFRKALLRQKLERSKATDRRDDSDVISLKLGNVEKIFSNGRWVSRKFWKLIFRLLVLNSELDFFLILGCNDERDASDNATLIINDLEEKNNLLRLKYEILMDMVILCSNNYSNVLSNTSCAFGFCIASACHLPMFR